ncbi:hypothetical protein QY694_20640, partial [Xanthomonas campestris pv. incanae]|nr:hypothetical protein [Xanthomonas campestris pv. incanae]MEA9620585.1 hypothetical protein [Xanthomonas campestris pv. incanae]
MAARVFIDYVQVLSVTRSRPRPLLRDGWRLAAPRQLRSARFEQAIGDAADVLEPVHDLLSNSAKKAKWMNCRLVLS